MRQISIALLIQSLDPRLGGMGANIGLERDGGH